MHAVKAVVQDGKVILDEPLGIEGRHEAVVVVLDPDPWEAILQDPRPRPELTKASQEALREFLAGNATPLDSEKMP